MATAQPAPDGHDDELRAGIRTQHALYVADGAVLRHDGVPDRDRRQRVGGGAIG
jgi:hypothetical protein